MEMSAAEHNPHHKGNATTHAPALMILYMPVFRFRLSRNPSTVMIFLKPLAYARGSGTTIFGRQALEPQAAEKTLLSYRRMSFAGMKVLSLESRRAKEIAELIRGRQGEPFIAPSMREAPLERNEEAFRFAEKLFAGQFDMVVLLTGVGTRLLNEVVATRYPAVRFAEALRAVTVVA